MDKLLKSLDEDVQKQISDLQEEQAVLTGLRDRKTKEQESLKEERDIEAKEIKEKLQELEEISRYEVEKIHAEKER